MNDLGLEKADHRFGESVIVGISDAAHGGLDPSFGEALGITNADILRPSVGMADELAALEGMALVRCLLEGIEHEARRGDARYAPADDPPGEGIDERAVVRHWFKNNGERDVDEAAPGRHVGKIR